MKKVYRIFQFVKHFIYMNSRMGSSIQRTRGSSRGLGYSMLKQPTPSYNSSIRNQTNNTYQANI